MDQILEVQRLLREKLPPTAARVDVDQEALDLFKAGATPPAELADLLPRTPPLFGDFVGPMFTAVLYVVEDIPARGWRAFDADGQLLAEGQLT